MIQYWDLETVFDTELLIHQAIESVKYQGRTSLSETLEPLIERFTYIFTDFWIEPIKKLYDDPACGSGFSCTNGPLTFKVLISAGRVLVTITDNTLKDKNKHLTLISEWPLRLADSYDAELQFTMKASRFNIQGIYCSGREAVELLRNAIRAEVKFQEDRKIGIF